jgi:hypothetical protein
MQKREPLLTEQHFDLSINRRQRFVIRTEEQALLSAEEVRLDLVHFGLFRDKRELFELKYSRGYAIQELRADFLVLVDSLETFRRFPDPDGDSEGMFFNGEQDEYMQAVELLKGFLAGWYESLDTVWYNIHAHRADAAGFTGYWCWEAAAVACFLGANDQELRAMRYYPADLADYAYGRKPQPATDPG